MLKTGWIKSEREISDGKRISIMSRHTLNDGITPDPEITATCFDEWLPVLGPPPRLIGNYYKRGLSWNDFQQGYLEYSKTPAVDSIIKELAELALKTNINLLCIEETPYHCHRKLIVDRFIQLQPNLSVSIR